MEIESANLIEFSDFYGIPTNFKVRETVRRLKNSSTVNLMRIIRTMAAIGNIDEVFILGKGFIGN